MEWCPIYLPNQFVCTGVIHDVNTVNNVYIHDAIQCVFECVCVILFSYEMHVKLNIEIYIVYVLDIPTLGDVSYIFCCFNVTMSLIFVIKITNDQVSIHLLLLF